MSMQKRRSASGVLGACAAQAFASYHLLAASPPMNLARHSISATDPLILYDVRYDPDCSIFTISTPAGFAIYRTCPLELVKKRGMLL